MENRCILSKDDGYIHENPSEYQSDCVYILVASNFMKINYNKERIPFPTFITHTHITAFIPRLICSDLRGHLLVIHCHYYVLEMDEDSTLRKALVSITFAQFGMSTLQMMRLITFQSGNDYKTETSPSVVIQGC